MQTQIVILAAGKGVRMNHPELPKVLIPLKGQPIISYILREVKKIREVWPPIIVIGYKSELVRNMLGGDFVYALQGQQLGTAHAVLAAQRGITAENLLVLYGDVPFVKAESLEKLISLHQQTNAKLTMFTAQVPNFASPFDSLQNAGRIIRNSSGEIVKIIEYKDASELEQDIKEVNPGIYLFQTQWLWKNLFQIKNLNAQQEYYLTDIVELATQQGLTIDSLDIDPLEVLGINTPEQLQRAEQLV